MASTFDEINMKGQLLILIVSAMVAGAAATFSIMEYVNNGRMITVVASAMTSLGTTLTCFGQIRMIEKQTKELIELSK